MNAIMNKHASDVKGCSMYSSLFPCNDCAKLIIQSGIREVVFYYDKPDKPEMIASRRMFDKAGVVYRCEHILRGSKISIYSRKNTKTCQ